jgi:DNA invertase Pin-like site-specific DNA recombinase
VKIEQLRPTSQQAYSYVRFSSPEQARGDSLRRQTELAEKYAIERGLHLNSLTFRDLGISAFSGSNRTEGALSAFIRACQTGRVPRGSVLLVESLDRLSREEVRKALRLLLELIDDHGIEVHTLGDNRVYGPGTQTEELIMSIIIMSRAREESERKSQRVREKWRQKKMQAAQQLGIAITAKVPLWIRAVKDQPLKLIPERAKVVKKIFELALSGLGSQLIAQYLNEHHATFTNGGKGWHKSYVEKILNHPATYGAYVPHKRVGKNKRVYDGEPILGFFPAAVDYATFQAVQAARDSRYRERKGSTSATMRNLFAGIIRDVNLSLPMVYYLKGNELMTDSYRLGKKPHRISYTLFEKGFLQYLDQLDITTILDPVDSTDLRHAEKEIGQLALAIERGEMETRKLTDLLLDTPSTTLKKQLLQTEAQIEKDKTAREAAVAQLEELKRKHADLLDTSIVYSKIAQARDLETRTRLRAEIRRKVSQIELDFRGKLTIPPEIEAKLAGLNPFKPEQITCVIKFVNGRQRRLLFERGFPKGVMRMVVVEPGVGYRATWLKPKPKSAKPEPPDAPPKKA